MDEPPEPPEMDEPPGASGKHPCVGLTLAAIAGIVLADRWPVPFPAAGLIVLASFGVWLVFRRAAALLLFAAAVFFLLHTLPLDRNPARELAAFLQQEERAISGSGWVDSVPLEMISGNGKTSSSFHLAHASLRINNTDLAERFSVLVNWPNAGPKLGDRVRFEGNLRNVEPPRNPAEFDYAAWLARQQIFSEVAVPLVKNATIVAHGSRWNPRRLANELKLALAELITRDLRNSPVEAGVISAMMLGTKEDTPDSTLELFIKTGTLHLFSVSGLHVTMLAAIALFLLVALRLPRRVALLLTIPTVFAYAFITGWSPSSVRAAMMTSAFVAATLLDRPSLSINTLAASCFLILAAGTNQLFSAGFQLSFSVVAVIILLSAPLTRVLKKRSQPDPFIPKKLLTPLQKSRWLLAGRASAAVALTLSAWAGSLPLTAWYFSLLSPVALLANLVIIPLSFGILILGVLGLLSALVSSWMLVAFNNASWAGAKLLLFLLGVFTALPGSAVFVGPHWWQRAGEQRVTFFDLGSGGGTVIETSAGCWLIDCGSEADYRRIVRRYLQARGINRVNGIFLTHGDAGHVGGIAQFLLDFPEAAIFAPQAGREALTFRRLAIPQTTRWVEAGASLPLENAGKIEVLWPPATVDGGRADDHCLVLRLTLAGQTFLLAGDSGLTTEMNLLADRSGAALRADWLFLGRNRDDAGGSKKFFERVGAQHVLATAAPFPSAEHVPAGWSEICRELQQTLLRFDQTGAVQIVLQKDQLQVKTFAGREQTVAVISVPEVPGQNTRP